MTREQLSELQRYPLKMKEYLTKDKIRELLRHLGHDSDGFYVSFSGGKDSEVAVDLVAKTLSELGYSKMNVLYINTGLEYTSVTKFAPDFCKYVSEKYGIEVALDVRYPKKNFKQVLQEWGYPLISKEVCEAIESAKVGIRKGDGSYERERMKVQGTLLDKNGNKSPYNVDKYAFLMDAPFDVSKHCCPVTKVSPATLYEKETGRMPLIATLAQESKARETKWLRFGCNAFNCNRPTSAPFSFWTENDILEYIQKNSLPIAEAYGKVVRKHELYGQVTLSDMFGFDVYDPDDGFVTTGCERTGCIFCLFGIQFDKERILRMQKLEPKRADFVLRGGEFNESGKWVPSKDGLGYWYILDYLSEHGISVPYVDNNYRRHSDAA